MSELYDIDSHNILLEFKEGVTTPDSHNIVLEFVASAESGLEILPTSFTQENFGQPQLTVSAVGIFPFSVFGYASGTAKIWLAQQFVKPTGILGQAFSTPVIKNFHANTDPQGFNATRYGQHLVYNLLQKPTVPGFNASRYGEAYVQGGVKEVRGSGFNSAVLPQPKAINTRADQYVDLRSPSCGIAPPTIDRPNVSPRILYPMGILPGAFGTAWVKRNPSPKGFVTDSYGTAWVSHSPRYLKPDFVKAFESGYAKVFDPTQKVGVSGVNTVIAGGIFGDIAIRNKRRFIQVIGSDQSDYGNWSSIFSNLTKVLVQSFDAAVFGNNTIWNKTPSVIPGAWDSNDFGQALIADRIRRVNARGIDFPESQRFGKHTLKKPPELFPAAFNSLRMGSPEISNKRRTLEVNGFSALQLSANLTVWFRARYLTPDGVNTSSIPAPKIEHGVRFIQHEGADQSRYGVTQIWFRVRKIEPSSIQTNFASNHRVGGTQYLKPDGFIASRFGTRIIPEIQSIYHQGIDSQSFGLAKIELYKRWIRAQGFYSFGQQASDRYGTAKIWNKRQYIKHNYDSGDGLNPGGFGQWTAVINRNIEIKAFGADASKFGYQQIVNHARPLLPSGFNSAILGRALIAERIRYLRPESMDAPHIAGWTTVFNTAFVLKPPTWSSEGWGKPGVVNTRREYRWIGAFESMLFGQAMISHAIRAISIESRYAINPISIPLPKVDLHTRYIEPVGKEYTALGGPFLSINWNIITTRWSHRELFGSPVTRNVTPELRQRGNVTEEFGKPSVVLLRKYLTLDGYRSETIPKPVIAYRNRSYNLTGFTVFGIGRPTVIKTGAPPYSEQTVSVEQKGIGHDITFMGSPSLRTNVIFATGFNAANFGVHFAQSNSIIVDSGIQELAFGALNILLRNRNIQVPSLGDLLQLAEVKPRVSPHTIYAVKDAPTQAIVNHQPGDLHYVNSDGGRRAPGEVFGAVTVTLQHRTLRQSGAAHSFIGVPSLRLSKHYIAPQPINAFRFGWHLISDGLPRQVGQYESSDTMAFGTAKIEAEQRGPRYITPTRLIGPAEFSKPMIDFRNRQIRPTGFITTQMGNSRGGDTLYKPQSLWVGEPKPTIPVGTDTSIFGQTRIGLRVREVVAEGFEAFASELDISEFGGRMKVILVKKPVIIESKQIKPQTIGQASSFGVPDLRLKTHYIRPDGNSDQYRKGAPK